MIKVELDETTGVAIVHPVQTQGLSESDLEQLTARVDKF